MPGLYLIKMESYILYGFLYQPAPTNGYMDDSSCLKLCNKLYQTWQHVASNGHLLLLSFMVLEVPWAHGSHSQCLCEVAVSS